MNRLPADVEYLRSNQRCECDLRSSKSCESGLVSEKVCRHTFPLHFTDGKSRMREARSSS